MRFQTDLEKCCIASLAHQWMLCSEWVPSEWESKQPIKKHHNNPQVIHTSPAIIILWNKNMSACKKQIHHQGILNWRVWPKYQSIIHNTERSLLVNDAWFVHISLLIQMKWIFHWMIIYLWIVMFLISCLDSFWRHPFTAEDAFVSKWCNAAFLQICSDEETNSSTSRIAWGPADYENGFIIIYCKMNILISGTDEGACHSPLTALVFCGYLRRGRAC